MKHIKVDLLFGSIPITGTVMIEEETEMLHMMEKKIKNEIPASDAQKQLLETARTAGVNPLRVDINALKNSQARVLIAAIQNMQRNPHLQEKLSTNEVTKDFTNEDYTTPTVSDEPYVNGSGDVFPPVAKRGRGRPRKVQ